MWKLLGILTEAANWRSVRLPEAQKYAFFRPGLYLMNQFKLSVSRPDHLVTLAGNLLQASNIPEINPTPIIADQA